MQRREREHRDARAAGEASAHLGRDNRVGRELRRRARGERRGGGPARVARHGERAVVVDRDAEDAGAGRDVVSGARAARELGERLVGAPGARRFDGEREVRIRRAAPRVVVVGRLRGLVHRPVRQRRATRRVAREREARRDDVDEGALERPEAIVERVDLRVEAVEESGGACAPCGPRRRARRR